MHKDNLDKRHTFADGRQPAVRISPESVCSYPNRSGSYAVHGSQFENYMLLGVVGKTISAMIVTYTFNDPSSVAVLTRVLPRLAHMPRSAPNLLLLEST